MRNTSDANFHSEPINSVYTTEYYIPSVVCVDYNHGV